MSSVWALTWASASAGAVPSATRRCQAPNTSQARSSATSASEETTVRAPACSQTRAHPDRLLAVQHRALTEVAGGEHHHVRDPREQVDVVAEPGPVGELDRRRTAGGRRGGCRGRRCAAGRRRAASQPARAESASAPASTWRSRPGRCRTDGPPPRRGPAAGPARKPTSRTAAIGCSVAGEPLGRGGRHGQRPSDQAGQLGPRRAGQQGRRRQHQPSVADGGRAAAGPGRRTASARSARSDVRDGVGHVSAAVLRREVEVGGDPVEQGADRCGLAERDRRPRPSRSPPAR